MGKKIRVPLSAEGMSILAQKILDYQHQAEMAAQRAIQRLMDEGGYIIGLVTNGSYHSELSGHVVIVTEVSGEDGNAKGVLKAISDEVPITWKATENGQVVDKTVMVDPLLMYEFGSGSAALDSAILKGLVGRGTFPGQTHAFQSSWWYATEEVDGHLAGWVETSGISPMRPMYRASEKMIMDYERFFREEFARISV